MTKFILTLNSVFLSSLISAQRNARIPLPELVPVRPKPNTPVIPFTQVPGVNCGKNLDSENTEWHVIVNVCTKSDCFSCSGALISDRYILTTAHCVETLENDGFREKSSVIVGSKSLPGDGRSYAISNVTIHDDWSRKNIGNGKDVALLRTVDQIKLSDEVMPICLPYLDFCFKGAENRFAGDDISMVTLSGFGSRGQNTNLQSAETILLKQSECESSSLNFGADAGYGNLPDEILCAYELGGYNHKNVFMPEAGCLGDSGSPLAVGFKNNWYLYGLLSFSNGCTDGSKPAIFTRMTSYTSWVWDNSNGEILADNDLKSFGSEIRTSMSCDTDERGHDFCSCTDVEEPAQVSQSVDDMEISDEGGELPIDAINVLPECDAGCSHACYTDSSGNNFCACPSGMYLPSGGDEKTCAPLDRLLFTFQSAIGPDNTITPTFGDDICMFKKGKGLRKGQRLSNGPCKSDDQMYKWRFDQSTGKIMVGDENLKKPLCVMQDHRTGFRPVKLMFCDKKGAKEAAKKLLQWVNVEGRLRPVNRDGYCLQFAGPGAQVVTGPCMNNYLGIMSIA